MHDEYDGQIEICLICSFGAWLMCNVAFFRLINHNYMHTFFDLKTGPEYTIERYLTTTEDHIKFDAVFLNQLSFTKPIHKDVKTWIARNIERWRADGYGWFDIELIPDEFLPPRVVIAEGGAQRRRSTVRLREVVGLANKSSKVHPGHDNLGDVV